MEASLRAKDLLMKHYEKVSGVPMDIMSKMVQFFNTDSNYKTAKECALITVEEILNDCVKDIAHLHYWVAVKNELIKL